MNCFYSSADRELPITAVQARSNPIPYPIHSSRRSLPFHVRTPSRAWSDEAFQGTGNSWPPPCFMLFLCTLLPVTEVRCFHRKLDSLSLRWILCIARYLLVRVFYRLCMYFLLSLSCSHFSHRTSDHYKIRFSRSRIVLGLHVLISNIRISAHLLICAGWRSHLLSSAS